MIFGDAEQHEQLGVIPIGLTEFPERAAHGVDAGRRHVDRAEAAVCRVVGRAKALRPEGGKDCDWSRPVKNASFSGLSRGSGQPVSGDLIGLFPADFFELARSARPTRFIGARRREGALCCMMPAEPLAQSTPLFTG